MYQYHVIHYVLLFNSNSFNYCSNFFKLFCNIFGNESRLRKEALNRMEEVMAKEHEMLSLGGQAAAAAHSLGTPLSTIKLLLKN